MPRLGTLAKRYGLAVLVLVAAVESAVEVAARGGSRAPTTTAWFAAPAVAVLVLLLLGRARFAFAAPALVWLLAAGLSFVVDGRLVVFTSGVFAAGLAAALLLGNQRDARQARVGLALVLAGSGIVVWNDPSHPPSELVFTPVLFAIGWLVGFALRERSAQAEAAEARASQAERERELAARVAVAEERARIARELHDVVAHAMSVMVLQVGAVRHRLPDDRGADRGALADVERAGRGALAEMRRLLGAMRDEDADVELAPQPGLGRLEPLLEEVRRAGLPVALHVEGRPIPLPSALDLSAYRIVQEGLTNALRHAHARRAEVILRYDDDELGIDVRDDGRGASTSDGAGHGLVGIRERVRLYGGEMSAGSVNGDGYVLSTRLPLGGAVR